MADLTGMLQAAAGAGVEEGSWDIATASWTGSPTNWFRLRPDQPIGDEGSFYLSPDGLRLYVVSNLGSRVAQYTLSTAWDIYTASFVQNFTVDALQTTISFKTDGTVMFVAGNSGMTQYNLSTAWDISTASSVYTIPPVKIGRLEGLFFKEDGTEFYTGGPINRTLTWSLSSAWDLSTATYKSSPINFSFLTGDDLPTSTMDGLYIRQSDGLKAYVCRQSKVHEYTLNTAWNITTATLVNTFTTAYSSLEGVSFKSDGLIMYVVSAGSDLVAQYQLSTAWNISTASFTKTFSVAGQDTTPTDLFFRTDGTRFYVLGDAGNDINEYRLSTAWDIATASFNSSIAVGITSPQGVFFRSDGLKMYVTGNSVVREFTLSTAWTVSTASFTRSQSVLSSNGVSFRTTGLTLFLATTQGYTIQVTLSTAWDVSTISAWEPTTFQLSSGNTGLAFDPTGVLFSSVQSGGGGERYSLSTPFDLATASFISTFSPGAAGSIRGIAFNDDGTEYYVLDFGDITLQGYTAVTPYVPNNSFMVPPTQATSNYFSFTSQETATQGGFFKPDGTRLFIIGSTGDDVNEYALSTAWDITTSSYVQNFSVSAQETVPTGLFFKSDGLVMYIVGSASDSVHQYALSSAWDISTASFTQSFSVSAQDTIPTGLFFKPEGDKMYVSADAGNGVDQYELSTPWDISTASFTQYLNLNAQTTSPQGIFFRPNGLTMFVSSSATDNAVLEYTLSVAWDISTATYVQQALTVKNFYNNLDVLFRSNGSEMYVIGSFVPVGSSILRYQLS